jgi:hypothetical protein
MAVTPRCFCGFFRFKTWPKCKRIAAVRSHWVLVITISLALSAAALPGESAVKSTISANQLAAEVVQNELRAQTDDRSLWKYRESSQEDGTTKLFEVVDTRQGEIRRLLEINGKPLSAQQRLAEDARIRNLIENPQQFQQKQNARRHDADQEQGLLKMLPAAFLYHYDGTRGNLVGLRFTPNPNFSPTGREGQVFHHMEGTLWVDPQQKRLEEIDGRLTSEVKFWYGLLGHLDKGGTFSVKQKDMGGGHWEMTLLNVQMNGKALFFKTIAVREKEVYSDFEPLPENTSLRRAAEILKIPAKA